MAHVSGIEFEKPTKAVGSRGTRLMWLGLGHLMLALGVIGAFVPLMPTTVFLILAASCYARSSSRLHRWLLSHRTFGPVLRDWEDHRSMRRTTKRVALTAIVIAFTATFFAIPLAWVRVIHVLIGSALVAFILKVPTRG